jgi:hypothetical protein
MTRVLCGGGEFGVRSIWLTALSVSIGFLLTLGSPHPSYAQAVYGSITGVITDNSGGALPGVTVTVTSVERKTTDSVVTNDTGRFVKERLLPGEYEVKAEMSGFKTALAPSVRVSVDTQTPIDMQLEVGALTEAITVTGGAPLLKTDRADVSTTFETGQITSLPILDRNATKFLLLTPGTQQLNWQHAASENPQGSVQIQVNGQHFSGTDYQLDGTQNRDPILGIIVINPTFESMQEMKITSQNYDAEFGATAGVVSTQTKSGTNSFHGSVFEFYRDERFAARNPFTQPTRDALPDTTRNQFGGSVGGPILQNRLFFFSDYEGTRSKEGGSRLLTVPTEAARRGDLSAYSATIYDPATGATPAERAAFAGNVIPTGRLSAQAQALLALIPLPNQAGVANGTRDNFIAQGSETFDGDIVNVRIDSRINENMNLFGRYSVATYFRDGPTAFGQGGGEALVSLGGVSDVTNNSLALGVDRVLSPTLFADFRFGFFRYKVNVLPFDFGTSPATNAGIPGLNFDDFTSGLFYGNVEGEGAFEFGSGLDVNRCNCPLDQNEKQWQAVGNVTKLAGSHTFKMGIDVRRAYNLRIPSDAHRSGQLTFNADRTRGASGGMGLATFLLGDVSNFRRYVSSNLDARERQWRHYYYAQDTWRVNRKLTLNYGLRLDIINPQTVNEAANGGWLDLTTGLIRVGGVGDIALNGNIENSWNWSPRVGATYQLNEKTVIRGAYGRSYDIGVFGSLFGHSVTQNLPVLALQEINAPNNFDRVFTLASGPPAPASAEVPANGLFPLPNGVGAKALPLQQRPPRVDAYNVMVQRQLTETMAIEAGYVGNRSANAFAGDGPGINANQPTLEGFGTLNTNQRRPFFNGSLRTPIEGLGGAYGWTQGIDYFCNCSNTKYDSMQVRLTKRQSNGYSATLGYTLQKAQQEGGDYFFWNPDVEQGLADWDRTNVFTAAVAALLPIGKGQRFMSDASTIADAFIGGWQFNTNFVLQSGVPFNVTYRGAGADRDVGPNRPNLVSDFEVDDQSRERWFNATPIGSAGSAFDRPAAGTFGNLKRNTLRGPAYWRVDASLFKNFSIGANRTLQARFEATNLLNHVNLHTPDAEIGVPGNDNPNAGRITRTAFDNADPPRFFQFGLRFTF